MDNQPYDPAQAPPGAPGQPPQAPQYQEPVYQPQQVYSQGPAVPPDQSGYPPPQPRPKGFNWLACCGIGCGVILVGAILVAVVLLRVASGVKGMVNGMHAAASEVRQGTTEAATEVSPEELAKNPTQYEGTWITVEGKLKDSNAGTSGAFSSDPELQNATPYWILPNVMVLDLSQTPPVGSADDTVRATGIVKYFDMAKLPVFGKWIAKQMQQTPEFHGASGFPLLLSNKVELVGKGEPEGAGGETPAGTEGDTPAAPPLGE